MRIANVRGRALLLFSDDSGVDIETASEGKFSSDVSRLFDDWSAFVVWAKGAELSRAVEFTPAEIDAPSPRPRQVFAIGLNYKRHAAESGFSVPESPTVFTKFPSCITGPNTDVRLPPGGNVDWEVELVAVIGQRCRGVEAQDAWNYVAGLTLGQDLSERIVQAAGPSPQFSLGKSFEGFGPTGPWLATPDEFKDLDAISLGCSVNGEQMQSGNTRDLVFSIPQLISDLSMVVTLHPGDLIFTGTPEGVGLGRNPQVWLSNGDVLTSWADNLGKLHQRMFS